MRYIIEINDLMNKIAELGEQLVIVDVRKNIDDRLIPGAVRIDVRRDLSGENEFFAAPEQIAQRLGDLGINSIKTVVFIDDGSNRNSAKALFALYQLGHKGHLAILQGGYPSWQTAGITLELIERQPTTYDYTLRDDAVMSFEEVKDRSEERRVGKEG